MKNRVKDLSIDELKQLIKETVKDTIEDILEDYEALSSNEYVKSIEEARMNYKEGRVKSIEELDV